MCPWPAHDQQSHWVSLSEVLGSDYHVGRLALPNPMARNSASTSWHASLTNRKGETRRARQKEPRHLYWKSAQSTCPVQPAGASERNSDPEPSNLGWKFLLSEPRSSHVQNEETQPASFGRLNGTFANCLLQHLKRNRCSNMVGTSPWLANPGKDPTKYRLKGGHRGLFI